MIILHIIIYIGLSENWDPPKSSNLPSGNLTSLLKMAIEIVDFPIKNSDFP